MHEIICKIGVSTLFYETHKSWLHADSARRLFFLDDESSSSVVSDRQVLVLAAHDFMQRQLAIRKIGHMAAFKQLWIVDDCIAAEIQEVKLLAESLLSEWADFGVRVCRHQRMNAKLSMYPFAALRDAKKNVPAVIVGAGPSLEKVESSIPYESAFIIAAGSALPLLEKSPHLAVAVCPFKPLFRGKHLKTPLCVQRRVHPESAKGPLLWMEDAFDGGWSVGNTAMALAFYLGCNPIVLVGMDLCYSQGRKYAKKGKEKKSDAWIESLDCVGKRVFTQRDWLVSAHWFHSFAANHPQTQFFDATALGLYTFAPQPLSAFSWPKRDDLALDLQSLSSEPYIPPKLDYELLWNLWAPLFERELMIDPHPLSIEQKLNIQKQLFFDQIQAEHGR